VRRLISWFQRLMPESEVKRWLRQKEEEREKQSYCFHLIWNAVLAEGFIPMLSGGKVYIYSPSLKEKILTIPVFS